MNKKLGVLALTLINLSTILSIRNWPVTAEYGLSSAVYLIAAALLYLVPIALVSAELATGWPEKGGIFAWVREAFGKELGFVTIFLLWASNVVWYPLILSFVAAAIAYAIAPGLAENALFQVVTILGTFWTIMYLSMRGMHFSSWLSTWGVVLGTLLPGALLIAFGAAYYFSGEAVAIPLDSSAWVPRVASVEDLVFIQAVLLGFAGMEMTAVHANDVEEPTKNYPRAIFISTFWIVLLSIIGTLAVAIVIPKEEIGLITACLEALRFYFAHYGILFLMPVVTLFVTFGAVGGISSWLAGPSKGLHAACVDLGMHDVWTREENGMPRSIMLLQGGIVTAMTLTFFVMPSVDSAFWFLTALATLLYLIVYFFLFATALYLRITQPHVERAYKVPGGLIGMGVVSLLGLANTTFCFVIGFLPPSQLDVGNTAFYIATLLFGTVVSCSIPYYYALRAKQKLAV